MIDWLLIGVTLLAAAFIFELLNRLWKSRQGDDDE